MLHKYGTGGKREQDWAALSSPGSINDQPHRTKGPIAAEPALPIDMSLNEKRALPHSAALNEVQDQQQDNRADKGGEQAGD